MANTFDDLVGNRMPFGSVPVSEVLTGSDSPFTFDQYSNVIPNKKDTPNNVQFVSYNWQKQDGDA